MDWKGMTLGEMKQRMEETLSEAKEAYGDKIKKKSKSQEMRITLMMIWQKKLKENNFKPDEKGLTCEMFYEKEMDKIIEHYKTKYL